MQVNIFFSDISRGRPATSRQSSTDGDFNADIPIKSNWTSWPADILSNISTNAFCTSRRYSKTQEELKPWWLVNFGSLYAFTYIFVAGNCNYNKCVMDFFAET